MKKGYLSILLLMTLTTAAIAADQSSQTQQQGSQQQGQAPPPGPGNRVTQAGLESIDQQFVAEAAMGGMAEVAMGRLAAQKASNAEVKRFGQRMVDDHTRANQELKQLAARKNITLPPDPMSGSASGTGSGNSGGSAGQTGASQAAADRADSQSAQPQKGMHGGMSMDPAEHKAMMDRLSRLSGAEFDREYMRGQLKDHEKTIALFEQQVSQGVDKDLQAFAKKTLPTLREHDRMARQIARSVGVTDTGR